MSTATITPDMLGCWACDNGHHHLCGLCACCPREDVEHALRVALADPDVFGSEPTIIRLQSRLDSLLTDEERAELDDLAASIRADLERSWVQPPAPRLNWRSLLGDTGTGGMLPGMC